MTLSTVGMRRLRALELLATDEPVLAVSLPFRLDSRANDHQSNHWGPRAKASAKHRMGAHMVLVAHKRRLRALVEGPGLVVRVVRIAPSELDHHDNLPMATKALIDGAADALGLNDRDHRATFVPDTERGPWGARLEFYPADGVTE